MTTIRTELYISELELHRIDTIARLEALQKVLTNNAMEWDSLKYNEWVKLNDKLTCLDKELSTVSDLGEIQ